MNRTTHLRLNVIGARGAAVWAVVGLWACVAANAQSGLTPEIAAGLKSVTNVAIDPAGRRTAYVLSVPRDADDEHGPAYSEIWMVDIASGDKRRFTRTRENASSPQWSPDGSKIAYLTKRSGDDEETQIFTLPIDGGESEPFTKHETSISGFEWSPDGRWIAFTAADPKSDDEKSDQEAGRDWNVVDKGLKLTRLWVADAESGASQAVYDVDLSVGSFVWTPDSNALIVQAADTPRTDDGMLYRSIYGVPREGGEPALICETRGKLGGMSVSPDGSQLAFLGATSLNDPLPQSLFVVNLPKGLPRNLTDGFAGSAQQVEWIDDAAVLLLAAHGARTGLMRVNARTGKLGKLVDPGPIFNGFDLHAGSGRFAAIASAANHASEVYLATLESSELRRLTNHNPVLDSLRFAKQQIVEWKGADDLRIEATPASPCGPPISKRPAGLTWNWILPF